jgi:hypothetical protein
MKSWEYSPRDLKPTLGTMTKMEFEKASKHGWQQWLVFFRYRNFRGSKPT